MISQITVGSTSDPLVFGPVVLASDHRTAATGLAFTTLEVSKNTAAFAAPAGTVVEVGNGFYALPAAAGPANYSAIGPLILHAEADLCDPYDLRVDVVSSRTASPLLQHTSSYPLTFLMVSSADHLSGATGLAPTVTLSKAAGSFAAPAGAVAEVGYGWYKVAGSVTDTSTTGMLILHATAPGCDATDDEYYVRSSSTSGVLPQSVWTRVFRRIVQQVEADAGIAEVFAPEKIRSWKGLPIDTDPFAPDTGVPILRLTPMPVSVDWYSPDMQSGTLNVHVEIAIAHLCVDYVADAWDLVVNALRPGNGSLAQDLVALGAETGEIVFADPAFDAMVNQSIEGGFVGVGRFRLVVLRSVNP